MSKIYVLLPKKKKSQINQKSNTTNDSEEEEYLPWLKQLFSRILELHIINFSLLTIFIYSLK